MVFEEPVQPMMSLYISDSGSSVQYARGRSSRLSRTSEKCCNCRGYGTFAYARILCGSFIP